MSSPVVPGADGCALADAAIKKKQQAKYCFMGLPLGLAKGEPRPITESNTDPQGPGPGFTAPRARRGGLRSGVGRWTPDGKRAKGFPERARDAGRRLRHARKRIFGDPARAFVEAVSIVQAERQAERAALDTLRAELLTTGPQRLAEEQDERERTAEERAGEEGERDEVKGAGGDRAGGKGVCRVSCTVIQSRTQGKHGLHSPIN